MKARTTSVTALPLAAAFCAMIFAGAVDAQAQGGRVAITKMYISNCEELGNCELRLTCQTGSGSPVEVIPSAVATNPQTVQAEGKQLDVKSFPAKVSCTLYEDDGWFGEDFQEAATGSVNLLAGGNYTLELKNPEQADVTVSMIADSFQVAAPAPPATPAAPAAPAARPGARPAAPAQFLGVFRKESEPQGHGVILGLDWPAFEKRVKELGDQGVHPMDVETWTSGGQRLWGAIFRGGPDSSLVVGGMEWEPFLERWTKLTEEEDMRLVDLEVYQEGGKTLFAGAFQFGSEQYSLWVGQSRPEFLTKWQQLVNQGLRLVDFEVYQVNKRNLYAGVFLEAPGGYGLWTAATHEQFREKWRNAGSGLFDVETYTEDGKRLYDGAILGSSDGEEMTEPLDAQALGNKWREMLAKGYRLIHLEVFE